MVLIIGNNLKKIRSTWIRMIQIAGMNPSDIKIFTSWKDLKKEANWEKLLNQSRFILLDHHLYPEDEITEENETNGRFIYKKISEFSSKVASKVYGISTEINSQNYLSSEKYLGNKDPDKVFRVLDQLRRN